MPHTMPDFIEDPRPELYLSRSFRVLDLETHNEDKGDARNPQNHIVLGHIITDKSESVPISSDNIARLFSELDGRILVAHNAKFELHWLKRLGYPIENLLVFDTMLAEKVLAGNRRWALDLDTVAEKYGGTHKNTFIKTMMEKQVSPRDMPRKELAEYCEEDCWNTLLVFKTQLEELQRLNLLHIVYTRCLLLPVLVDIECRGMQLDEERVYGEYNRTKREYDQCMDSLSRYLRGTNPGSPKQLAALLYDVYGFEELKNRRGEPIRTDKGARKTDKPTLARLSARTKEQEAFLALIKQQALLDTKLNNYLEKFRNACQNDGGTLYGSLSQAIPVTHRLSSQGGKYRIQLHNMDRTLKKIFKARKPGWVTWEADQAQLEFRGAAELTGDQQAKSDIINHVDVHAVTRDFLEAHGEKFLTLDPKDRRTEVKPMTFRPVYGGTSGTPAQKAYCKMFNEKYATMYKTQMGWTMQVLKDKVLITPWGMRFYWPDIGIRYDGKTTAHSEIFNYPVQSFCTAEIVPIGVIYTWHLFKAHGLEAFFINTVHDSIEGECPETEIKIVNELVNQGMVSRVIWYLDKVYKVKLSVPLEIETLFSLHWGDRSEAKAA